MRNKLWLSKYAVSSYAAVTIAQLASIISGYGIDGLLASMELTLFLAFTVSFLFTLFRLYTSRLLLNPIPTKGFDATDDHSLSDFLLYKTNPSEDYIKGIYFYPLLTSSNFINPLAMLSIIYLFCSCTIHFLIDSGTITLIDYLFLLAQSWIVYIFSLLVVMALFQSPSIYRFLVIQIGIDPSEIHIMKLLQKLFGINTDDTIGVTISSMRTLNSNGKGQSAQDFLAPVVQLLSRNYAHTFVEVYERALNLRLELNNATKEFNVSHSYFSDDFIVISEILDIYYPDVVAKSKKALSNTTMIEQIKSQFQGDMQKSIVSNVEQFIYKLDNINKKILALRLSAFDTTAIDSYIATAKSLHRQIKAGSGEWSNKHLVISTSVINELLPSLIDSWALSNDDEQKEVILGNFKGMVDFLQAQLAALTNSDIKAIAAQSMPLALELDSRVNLGELNTRINRDAQYIENLNQHWN